MLHLINKKEILLIKLYKTIDMKGLIVLWNTNYVICGFIKWLSVVD